MLQALSNNYACLQAHVNNALTWQSSCVIANHATKCYRRLRNNCSCLQALVNNELRWQNVTGT